MTSDSGYTTAIGYERFQLSARVVRDFFDATLKADSSSLGRLTAELQQTAGAVISHHRARPVPPSARELAAMIADKGFEAAKHVVDRLRLDMPDMTIIDEAELNRAGYNFIADKQFALAIGVLKLVTHVYPASWNAADSLGDAHASAGDKQAASLEYQRALELVTSNSSVDGDRRKSVIEDLQAKIRQ